MENKNYKSSNQNSNKTGTQNSNQNSNKTGTQNSNKKIENCK